MRKRLLAGRLATALIATSAIVPAVFGGPLFGGLDLIIDRAFGLPSAPGHNAVIFSGTNTSLAIDASISDLSRALAASSK